MTYTPDPFPFKVVLSGKGRTREDREKMFFWLWEKVGDCPKCPKSYRSAFAERGTEKKTTDVMWRYGKFTQWDFAFTERGHATLFRLKWG